MAKLLFRLNGVTLDEMEEVRTALEDAGYAFYETDEGRFGFGVAGFWLYNEEDYPDARILLDQLQAERSERMQQVPPRRFSELLAEKPMAVITMLIGVMIVLAFSVWPFLTAFE